jgi:peroxiredoxin
MAQLRRDYEKFVELDTEVIVVGPEGPAAFKEYWSENRIPFIGLPDPNHTVLKRYGQEINLFKFGRMPAMVVVDKTSQARFVHYGKSMSDIPGNKKVLAALRRMNRRTQRKQVPHRSTASPVS